MHSPTTRCPVASCHGLMSRLICLMAVLLVSAATAQAEDDALPDVAAAPRRMEVPIEQLAESITVIGRAEIERRGWRTLPDVLREVPGLHVAQSGGRGKTTSVFTRGTESDHTLVLIDGIEVSDPSTPGSTFDLAHLLTENIERVEVLRGPQSTLYGSEALGGVINIVTREGRGKPTASAWVETGAFGTFQESIGLHGGSDELRYSLSYSNLHTRGSTALAENLGGHERDGYENRSLSVRLGISPTSAAELRLFGRLIDTDSEIDGFGVEDPDSRGSTRQLFLRADGRLDLFAGVWRHRFGVSYTDHDRSDVDDPPAGFFVRTGRDGRRLKLDWQQDLSLGRDHVVTLGLETERESLDSTTLTVIPSTGHDTASVRTSSVFLQEQFSLADRVFGTLGARLEHHDEFGSQLTYKVAVAYLHPATGTKLRGTIATGFNAPSLSELFDPFSGNPDLDPDRSRGWDIGFEQPLWDGQIRLGVTYFQNRIRDQIDFEDVFPFKSKNTKRAKTDGFESFASLNLGERVAVRIDHTYTSAEDRSSNEDLLRRPSHQLRAKLEVRPIDGTTLSTSVLYVGHRRDIGANGRESLSGYTVANVAATYQLRPGLKLFGRIDNLFDRDYADPLQFQSPGFAGYFGVKGEY